MTNTDCTSKPSLHQQYRNSFQLIYTLMPHAGKPSYEDDSNGCVYSQEEVLCALDSEFESLNYLAVKSLSAIGDMYHLVPEMHSITDGKEMQALASLFTFLSDMLSFNQCYSYRVGSDLAIIVEKNRQHRENRNA